MPYLYHRKPADLRGSVLYPLNRLRERYPDVYAAQRAKYAGREALTEVRIPLLDVLWNDVVHCSPLHPHLFYAGLRAAGAACSPDVAVAGLREGRVVFNPGVAFFRIPVERLAPHAAVYWRPSRQRSGQARFQAEAFAPFRPDEYTELPLLPPEQLAYYREEIAAGRRPLVTPLTTHVLVAGEIDVAGLATVRWDSPGPASDTA